MANVAAAPFAAGSRQNPPLASALLGRQEVPGKPLGDKLTRCVALC